MKHRTITWPQNLVPKIYHIHTKELTHVHNKNVADIALIL